MRVRRSVHGQGDNSSLAGLIVSGALTARLTISGALTARLTISGALTARLSILSLSRFNSTKNLSGTIMARFQLPKTERKIQLRIEAHQAAPGKSRDGKHNEVLDHARGETRYDMPDYISRSEFKRDAQEVHRLAEALIELKPTEYKKLALDEDMRAHLDLARRIDAHIAKKRQILFVAKQLRKRPEILDELFAAVDKPKSEQKRATAKMHRLETLRDRLIADGDTALTPLLQQHPQADRQTLRTLVRQASAYKMRVKLAADEGKPPVHNDGSYSALYQALRELFATSETETAAPDATEQADE